MTAAEQQAQQAVSSTSHKADQGVARRKVSVGVFPMPHFLDKYLEECFDQYEVHIISPDPTFAQAERDILKWVAYCKKHGIKHISSFDHEYMIWQSILNELIGEESNSPTVSGMAFAMNKYHTRQIDDPSFWSCPVDVRAPEVALEAIAGRYPCMVKASCLNLARGVFTVSDEDELLRTVGVGGNSEISREAERFRDAVLRFLPSSSLLFPSFMAEMRLDVLDPNLKQFSVECLCLSDGQFRTYSVREELYFGNSQKLGYLCPPPSLPSAQIARLVQFTDHVGRQLVDRGFVNQFFNMEVWYLPSGDFRLVEVNVLPNPHFVGMNAQLTGKNYMRDFLNLHARQVPPSTEILDGLLQGNLGKTCLQSEMSCITPGRVADLFDMDALRMMPAENHCMMWVHEDDFELTKAHMSTAGWAVAEVFLHGTSLEDVLQKDEALRKVVYKVNRPLKYPNFAGTNGEKRARHE